MTYQFILFSLWWYSELTKVLPVILQLNNYETFLNYNLPVNDSNSHGLVNWKSADSLEPPPCFTYFGREVFRQGSSVKKSLLASINSHCEFCGCKCGGCLNINSATSCRAQGQYKTIHLWLKFEFFHIIEKQNGLT